MFFSVVALMDKSHTSKRNAMYYWRKQNLRKFDSKRNAMYFWPKRNLRKFDSSPKENWRNGDYAASVIRVAVLGKMLSGQHPQGTVLKQDE